MFSRIRSSPENTKNPTDGSTDADPIDLSGDGGGGGGTSAAEPVVEPEPEPIPAPTISVGGDADRVVTASFSRTAEPAPIVEREPMRAKVTRSPRAEITTRTDDPRPPLAPKMVFSQAIEVMSEGVGTTDILEEAASNPLQATFKGTSFVLSAGFLTWALRGASLLASVAASLPAWQGFDPLPILASKKRADKEEDEEERKDDDWQEKRVQRLLDPMHTAEDD